MMHSKIKTNLRTITMMVLILGPSVAVTRLIHSAPATADQAQIRDFLLKQHQNQQVEIANLKYLKKNILTYFDDLISKDPFIQQYKEKVLNTLFNIKDIKMRLMIFDQESGNFVKYLEEEYLGEDKDELIGKFKKLQEDSTATYLELSSKFNEIEKLFIKHVLDTATHTKKREEINAPD